jgi:hypothetical protein
MKRRRRKGLRRVVLGEGDLKAAFGVQLKAALRFELETRQAYDTVRFSVLWSSKHRKRPHARL